MADWKYPEAPAEFQSPLRGLNPSERSEWKRAVRERQVVRTPEELLQRANYQVKLPLRNPEG